MNEDIPESCELLEVNILPMLVRRICLATLPELGIINMDLECRILHVGMKWEDRVKDTLSQVKITA